MKRLVVDASIVVKWFLPEIHALSALRLLKNDIDLIAPELISPEVGNVILKKWRRGEIDRESACGIMSDFRRTPLQIHSSDILLEDTWNIAELYNQSFYDSLYIALAKRQECRLVTADLKLYNALKKGPLNKTVLWVEDIT